MQELDSSQNDTEFQWKSPNWAGGHSSDSSDSRRSTGAESQKQYTIVPNSVVPTELRSSIEAVGVIHFISQWVFSTPKASTLSLCLGSALSHTIDWAEKADFSAVRLAGPRHMQQR
eukprot:COSAG02_NODE_1722_length_11193_cov_39.876600_6_plen_116_part_00